MASYPNAKIYEMIRENGIVPHKKRQGFMEGRQAFTGHDMVVDETVVNLSLSW